MTLKAGKYLGGVRNLKDLRDRCRITDCGCWEWSMGTSHGRPCVSLAFDGKRYAINARRAAVMFSQKDPLPNDVYVWPADDCKNILCINPDHTKRGTITEMRSDTAKRNGWKVHTKFVKNGLNQRHRLAKITAEQAAEIRRSDATVLELCAKYGLSRPTVNMILAGKTWRDAGSGISANSSVFNWRPAA